MKNISSTVGFIFASLAICFGWVPYMGGIFWVIGALLSTIGLINNRDTLGWIGISLAALWIIAYIIVGYTFGTYSFFTIYPLWIW